MFSEEIIRKHFPELTAQQIFCYKAFKNLFVEWNSKINLVSRKDLDNFYVNHVLHSLSIAKFISFKDGTRVLDIGTGGGFPGIPLAIFFPQVNFTLVDSIGKKINAVSNMISALGLTNAKAINIRAEQVNTEVDFVVSRATAPLADLVKWSKGKIAKQSHHALPNGIICLKGGNLTDELEPFAKKVHSVAVTDFINEPFFAEKKIVYLPF